MYRKTHLNKHRNVRLRGDMSFIKYYTSHILNYLGLFIYL